MIDLDRFKITNIQVRISFTLELKMTQKISQVVAAIIMKKSKKNQIKIKDSQKW
jgi:hypothetical protein